MANDELRAYISRHERDHGPIELQGAGEAEVGAEQRAGGMPVVLQAGTTQPLSAKVALGLATPQGSARSGDDSSLQGVPAAIPSPDTVQPTVQTVCDVQAATPPRESNVIASARIALASPSPSVPTEVLLGAYRWQRRSEATQLPGVDDDFTWNSSVANLLDVMESPVSPGSSFTISNPLVDMSTEDEANVREITDALSSSVVLTSTGASVASPAETSSSQHQRQRAARRKQRRRPTAPEMEAPSDSSASSEERAAKGKRPRRQSKKTKLAKQRAAKIRAIVQEARDDRMLRTDLRCAADSPPQSRKKKSAVRTKICRSAAGTLEAHKPAAATSQRTSTKPASLAPGQNAKEAADPQNLASPLYGSFRTASFAERALDLNETQLDVYHTIGELRDRRDSILRRYAALVLFPASIAASEQMPVSCVPLMYWQPFRGLLHPTSLWS